MTDTVDPIPGATERRNLHLDDDFTVELPAGGVIGSATAAGETRLGVDVERLMAVDHGALRMRPLAKPGWGREGIAYRAVPPARGSGVRRPHTERPQLVADVLRAGDPPPTHPSDPL